MTRFGLWFVYRVIKLFQCHVGFAFCNLEIKMLNCTFNLTSSSFKREFTFY